MPKRPYTPLLGERVFSLAEQLPFLDIHISYPWSNAPLHLGATYNVYFIDLYSDDTRATIKDEITKNWETDSPAQEPHRWFIFCLIPNLSTLGFFPSLSLFCL